MTPILQVFRKIKISYLFYCLDLTEADWDSLNDRTTENETIVITNTQGKKYVTARYFIDSMTPDVN